MAQIIKVKRHLSDSVIPSVVLGSGEPLYMKITNRLYIGDGTTNAAALPYIGKDTADALSTLISGLESGTVVPLNATNATKLSSVSAGSSSRPVYFSNGLPTPGYYIPKLNGSNSSNEASFYAPITAGEENQVLVSTGGTPTWTPQGSLNNVGYAYFAGSATTATTATTATNVGDIVNNDEGANTTIAFSIGNKSYSKTITVNVPGTVDYAKQLYESGTQNPHDGNYYRNYNNLINKPSIPTVTDYYWANVKVSSASSTSASPIFGAVTVSSLNNYSIGNSIQKNYIDSTSASAISTGSNLVTERDVYYGLPNFNGSHSYNSSSSYYAPTSAGSNNYILKANSNGAPTWMAQSDITAGTADKLSVDAGSGTKFVYFSGGIPVATTLSLGNGSKPIYMSSGTLTASSSTVGSATKPIYMSSGTLTASSSTVGSATKPIYMSSGTLTASSSTVGSATRPVYLNGGVITQTGTSLAVNITGTASNADKIKIGNTYYTASFSNGVLSFS